MSDTSAGSSIILKIVPPVWLLTFLLLGIVVHYLFPTARVFDVSFPIAGGVLFVAGLALTLYSSSLFTKEKTEILPTSPTNRVLITYGSFRFTRNPMYLGMVMGLLGVALFLGSLPVYLTPLAQFLVLNFAFIPFEEKKMARLFGAQYEAYRQRVRRWL